MRKIFIAVALLALAIPGTAHAESGFKVTGGGQAFASSEDGQGGGPGDTYGFNAQDTDGDQGEAAKGQFNSIQRDASAETARGKGEHIKGAVTCLVALSGGEEGMARFGGYIRGSEFVDENTEDDPEYVDRLIFIVDVTDNGEGNESNDDVINYRAQEEDADNDGDPSNDPSPCSMERELEDNEERTLARGNVQVHGASEEGEPEDDAANSRAVGLLGL